MNIFYVTSEPSAARGLYSYWSATLGDAIVLPALVGALAEYQHHMKGDTTPPRWVGSTGLALGAAAGLATQVAWIMDPNVDPNWTIPTPHTFTPAGFYHAGFTVAISATLGYLSANTAWRIRERSRSGADTPPGARRALLVAGGAVIAFGILATADNFGNLDRSASAASLTALAAATAGLAGFFVWEAVERKRK